MTDDNRQDKSSGTPEGLLELENRRSDREELESDQSDDSDAMIGTLGRTTADMLTTVGSETSIIDRQPCSDDSETRSLTGHSQAGGRQLSPASRRRHRRHRRRSMLGKSRSQDGASPSGTVGQSRRRRLPRSFRSGHSNLSGNREWRAAMAPRNSNAFLIADHGIETPSFLRSPVSEPAARIDSSSLSLSDDDYFESGSEEGEFMERNFAQMYDQVHAESLSNLRHSDLVSRCLELEDEVASLKKQTDQLLSQAAGQGSAHASTDEKNDLLERLKAENDSLRKENGHLLEERRKSTEFQSTVER